MSGPTVSGLHNSVFTAFNTISTIPQQVATPNGARSKITFSVPGGVDVIVFPLTAYLGLPTPSNNQSQPLNASIASLGGGFRVFASGGEVVRTGQAAKQGYQALTLTGSGNPLTVMEESS
jgi:hypothetical protein